MVSTSASQRYTVEALKSVAVATPLRPGDRLGKLSCGFTMTFG
jgi:hypothetical protein